MICRLSLWKLVGKELFRTLNQLEDSLELDHARRGIFHRLSAKLHAAILLLLLSVDSNDSIDSNEWI